MELREQPDNVDLLISILAMIFADAEILMEKGEVIKDFDIVNYVLAKALKADQIKPEQIGVVLAYLDAVQAPSIYWQYVILRVHQNLHKVQLYDIAISLYHLQHLQESDKIIKVLNRVEGYLMSTPTKVLLGDKPALQSMSIIYNIYTMNNFGSLAFVAKLEQIIEDELAKKKYKMSLDDNINLMDCLARKRCGNINIWKVLLADIEYSISKGQPQLLDIYAVIRSLYAVKLCDDSAVKKLVEYLVKRGNDSDHIIKLDSEGKHRKGVHFIWLVAETAPSIKDKNFLTHVGVYASKTYQDMQPSYLVRLYDALKKLQNFKNDKVMAQLKRSALERTLADKNSKEQFNFESKTFGPDQPDYFDTEDEFREAR